MPIYEFHCTKCDRDSEILIRSSRWKGAKCPHCGSTKLTKKLSTFASAGGKSGADACAIPTGGGGGCGCCCGGGGRHRH